jgi:hypothetical protein
MRMFERSLGLPRHTRYSSTRTLAKKKGIDMNKGNFVLRRLLRLCPLLLVCVITAAQAQPPPGKAPLPPTLPTWPQQFAVTAPARASFGFMVTQPGPVTVDVTVRGAPVTVTLVGPAGQPVQQTGTGQVHLGYAVSAQELQGGLLWSLYIAVAVPGNGAQAGGSVVVLEPPIDAQRAQNAMQIGAAAATQALRARQALPINPQSVASLRSSLIASVQQRQALFQQAQLQLVTQEYDRIRPYFLKAQAGSLARPQTTAVLPPPQRSRLNPGIKLPLPPVSATAVSLPHATPGIPLIISGSGFGNDPGVLYFAGQSREVSLKIDVWTDTQIFTSVPDLTPAPAFYGSLYVVRNSDKALSNSLPFGFDPYLAMRFIVASKDEVLAWPFEPITIGGVAHSSYNSFTGFSGVDVLLGQSILRNGWKVADPSYTAITCGSVQPGDNRLSNCDGTASLLTSLPGNELPKFQVLWSLNSAPAFGQSRVAYMYSVGIVGPLGAPDGLACVQVPCDGLPNPANTASSNEADIMNKLNEAADSYAQLLQSTNLN